MPIDRSKYPANWNEISIATKEAASWRCEFCGVQHHAVRLNRRGRPYLVILTTAHLNSNPMDCRRENLRALCQVCHLRYDRALHTIRLKINHRQRKREKALKVGQLEMC